MQRFINQPSLSELFTGYWEQYIWQLPEAIFMKVNENFYRATFFELCSRHIGDGFTWNIERSYPSGKSEPFDRRFSRSSAGKASLEFVGKHHTKFAHLALGNRV